ncbi:MAG: acylphosphatase [Myxococcota bacterium]
MTEPDHGALTAVTARRVYVFGHVQGVSMRAHTRTQAVALGVTGWVRNLSDGRVEAWFEGTEDAVAALIDWCRTAKPPAHVEAVDVQPEHPKGHVAFEIRPSPTV